MIPLGIKSGAVSRGQRKCARVAKTHLRSGRGPTPMMDRAISVAGVPIRLTHERWFHIVENHDDVAGYYDDVLATIENPDVVLRGYRGTLIAVRNYGRRRYLMVVYRQVSADDGFIITAYFTSKLDRKQVVWRKP